VLTAILQSAAAGVGLRLAGVPFAAILTAVMFMLSLAQLGPLLVVETRNRQHIDVIAITGDEHGIDDSNLSDITETCQLLGDSTLEHFVVRETNHQPLNRSNRHAEIPPARHAAGLTASFHIWSRGHISPHPDRTKGIRGPTGDVPPG